MATYGLDKISTTYGTSYFRDEMVRIGREFKIERIIIPLGQVLAANMTITVKAFYDDASSNATLATINSTNYADKRNIDIKPQLARGFNNFFIQLEWSGTVLLTVNLPIIYEVEIFDS